MIRYFSLSFVESNGKASVSNMEWKCHNDINTNKNFSLFRILSFIFTKSRFVFAPLHIDKMQ